jgi:hypothetical protein
MSFPFYIDSHPAFRHNVTSEVQRVALNKSKHNKSVMHGGTITNVEIHVLTEHFLGRADEDHETNLSKAQDSNQTSDL